MQQYETLGNSASITEELLRQLSPQELDNLQSFISFGPIGSDKYPEYAREKIIAKYRLHEAKPELLVQRLRMWQKYEALLAYLQVQETDDGPVLDRIREFIKNSSEFAKKQLEETPPGGLGIHLKEVHEFSNSFLLTPDSKSRFAEIISDRDANLMSYVVGDIHDILKFLGSMDAQIMPDHEVMTAELIRRTLVNRKVTFADSKEEILTNEDVGFVAGVVGDHENIEKEKGRSDFINQGRIERAKALFFVIDVLTGALKPLVSERDGVGVELQIDVDQLWTRFGDLYLRHMDPIEGKIFRPQWGSYALGDLVTTFEVLEENGLVIVPPDGQELTIKKALKDIMFRAISLVIQAQTFHEQYNGFVRNKNIVGLQELSTKLNESEFSPLKKFREKIVDTLSKLDAGLEVNTEELLVGTLSQTRVEEVELARVKIEGL